jgi:Rrf2 family cysteine metabolism transcriptional repressor
MKLSTRTRYGIRAMFELAKNYGQGTMQLKAIAQEEEISVKYLEQLISSLKAAGLVNSVRGVKGGYVLARPPSQIKISDCYNCLEGPVSIIDCVDNKEACLRSGDCVARLLWSEIQASIRTILESTTLQDLVDKTQKGKILYYNI